MTFPMLNRRMALATAPYVLIAPALTLVLAVMGFGVVWAIYTSTYEVDFMFGSRVFVGFDNYAYLLTNRNFQNAMLRSTILAAGTITLGLVVSLAFALTLNALGRIIAPSFRAAALLPWLISAIAAATMFRFMFTGHTGLVNIIIEGLGGEPVAWLSNPVLAMGVLIVAVTWYIAPFSTLIILSGLQIIDKELYEAANLDGCSGPQAFRYVTVPMVRPMLGVALIWLSFASFNQFDVVLPLTNGGPGRSTEVMALFMYQLAFRELDYSAASAVTVIILVVNVVMSAIFFRLFRF